MFCSTRKAKKKYVSCLPCLVDFVDERNNYPKKHFKHQNSPFILVLGVKSTNRFSLIVLLENFCFFIFAANLKKNSFLQLMAPLELLRIFWHSSGCEFYCAVCMQIIGIINVVAGAFLAVSVVEWKWMKNLWGIVNERVNWVRRDTSVFTVVFWLL